MPRSWSSDQRRHICLYTTVGLYSTYSDIIYIYTNSNIRTGLLAAVAAFTPICSPFEKRKKKLSPLDPIPQLMMICFHNNFIDRFIAQSSPSLLQILPVGGGGILRVLIVSLYFPGGIGHHHTQHQTLGNRSHF